MAACLFAELRGFLVERASAAPGSITGPTSGALGGWAAQGCAPAHVCVCARGPMRHLTHMPTPCTAHPPLPSQWA